MNILQSKLNTQNPINTSSTVLKYITTITAMSALLAACGDHCVGGFKGYNHERCMQENADKTINTNTELEPTPSIEENTEATELEVVQHIGHACSEPDDNEIAKDFLSQEFKDSCETETRCKNNDHGCDSSTCQVQGDTFNICLTASNNYSIINSNGVWFNISCLNSSLENAPYCQITLGETLRLLEEYNYQCEDDYKFKMEARHVVFFTKGLLSNKTICDSQTESCFTTATYSRISSTMPDELSEICPTTNYGHCHALDVTVTLEEKADGERTYCLQATLNN